MIRAITKFDAFLIDNVFEPVLHALEAKTGITNFYVTRIVLCLTAAYIAVCYVNLGNYPAAAIAGLVSLFYVYYSLRLEAATRRRHFNSFRSSLPWLLLRVMVLMGIGLAFVELFTSFRIFGWISSPFSRLYPRDSIISSIGLSIAFYTLACMPLPPGFKKPARVVAHGAH